MSKNVFMKKKVYLLSFNQIFGFKYVLMSRSCHIRSVEILVELGIFVFF